MTQAVQMEFKHQLQCVSWEIKPQKYRSKPDKERENVSQPEKRVSKKQDSRTESVMLLLDRETDQGVSLGFQDWDIDPNLLSWFACHSHALGS